MIQLNKGPQPKVLSDNAGNWTKDLLLRLARGETVPDAIWRRYAHATVKDQAIADSHGKCIYCESKVRHISHGDLEHMKPKKRFPQGTYEWANLGFVCTKCNGSKLDKYDEATPPVNPFNELPGDFFVACGEFVWPRPGNNRATVTEQLASLNRVELLERRRHRLEGIRAIVELIRRERDNAAKAAFVDQLSQELVDSGEYAFCARAAAALLMGA